MNFDKLFSTEDSITVKQLKALPEDNIRRSKDGLCAQFKTENGTYLVWLETLAKHKDNDDFTFNVSRDGNWLTTRPDGKYKPQFD